MIHREALSSKSSGANIVLTAVINKTKSVKSKILAGPCTNIGVERILFYSSFR